MDVNLFPKKIKMIDENGYGDYNDVFIQEKAQMEQLRNMDVCL